jgi:hypothetical protein
MSCDGVPFLSNNSFNFSVNQFLSSKPPKKIGL